MLHRRGASAGRFSDDFDRLLEQLAAVPPIELGKPLPSDQHLPKRKVRDVAGRCPGAHNRLLFDRNAATPDDV